MNNKNRYLEMMRPKGNLEDGYAISNKFDKVFAQQAAKQNKQNIEEMMDTWIDKNIDRDKRSIIQGMSVPKLIKI
ncbi:hypothetical protein ACMVCI_002556 [Yersinia enterocolitica]|uniref:hypothetical protein n=1 Tax=Yersinia enterocolitica TaxID=630 RepID=UPI0005DD96B9|nr:hypothetical protein [Yersinia enterocolitica]EKN3574114.1 hypothetical protein [Yersinia enterocolitica]EKN4074940.1 hypothetical protein [Yersinia enterocolitica]EKN4143723.1 hypothetical protein [Yersinia enterocolitica]EKN4830675.1 hypothetical protein [Yersinia enterocolitica]EKN4853463.1 hypothetical protein [Yersinia enterocolitica]